MCPLSAFSQILILLFTILICCTALAQSLVLYLEPKNVSLKMYDHLKLNYSLEGELDPGDTYCLEVHSHNPNIANVNKTIYINSNSKLGYFNVYGNFLGTTNISVELKSNNCLKLISTVDDVKIKVARKERVIDKIFTISVAVLVSIIYINFGAALKIDDLKTLLKRPIGPVIGLGGQFLLMPLVSYIIGYALFPDNPALQLGIFFSGCSPGGGGSNIWTALLDGNIDLSIAMTTISTCIAFATIPFWTFTLGSLIFDRSNLEIPYRNISTYAVGLIVPLLIGFLIQMYSTRTAEILRRTLKGFSGLLIIFIVIFAIVTNLYLFKLFSWRIILSGLGLPWIGYVTGWLLGKVFNQSAKDCLTIAIEIGLHNTGIAIFLLRFALPQPEADLATIAPVSVAIMTPIPLFVLFLIKAVQKRSITAKSKKYAPTPNGTASDNETDIKPKIKTNGLTTIA